MKNSEPITDMLRAYKKEGNIIFHMPGHKGGRGFVKNSGADFLRVAGEFDVTEVPGTDNLNYPEGPIKAALEKCASAFGADKSFFLVNGSTCGIQAMIASACKPGDKLIVARDCHRSVSAAMAMFGVEPVYIYPEDLKEFGIAGGIKAGTAEKALRENPGAVGVLITRPTYYGICSDIQGISEVVHKYNKVLLVDEAHGAHLSFTDKYYPVPAVRFGDACVQSAHKTLPALNQGSWLHLHGAGISCSRVERVLAALQTSSPSYLIMASLDYARHLMETEGRELLERLYHETTRFKNILTQKTGFSVLGPEHLSNEFTNTPDRLVVNVRESGHTGFDIEKLLREKYKIQIEMSDLSNIVCICTVADRRQDFDALAEAMTDIWEKYRQEPARSEGCFSQKNKARKIQMGNLFFRETELVKINDIPGRCAGEPIVPYPPGIPFAAAGELFDEDDPEDIRLMLKSGFKINGVRFSAEDGGILVPCFVDDN